MFNIFSALAILSQSLTPYAVLLPQTASAQEVTPVDPTPTVDQSTVTETATPTPTVEQVTPTQDITPTPTDIPTEEVTPLPTEEVTPTDSQPVDNNSPPVDNGLSGETTTVTPTVEPATITPNQEGLTPSETKDEQLSIIVLDNVSAPSLNLETVVEGSATLTTDKADYAPTDTALITGSNLLPNTKYNLTISSSDQPATSTTVEVTSDASGIFAYAYQLDGTYRPDYKVELRDLSGNLVATTTFTDGLPKPGVNLDQCANGGVGSPAVQCSGAAWQNGNLNENQAHYFEGDSVPYRAIISDVTAGVTYTIKLNYDTTQSGKHATDYLTSFDRTEVTADPCTGVAGVPNCASSTTWSIPLDPNVSGGGVTQIGGQVFKMYNGTISANSLYTLSGTYAGSSNTSIILTFTANASGTTVLAWAGHIATRQDWGVGNSAVAISGSPYHMRVIDFTCTDPTNCGVGNQDRSLSAGAIIYPASITIIKEATPEGSTSFPFTASPTPLSNFSLVDDGTTANTKVFSNITNFQTYSVSETTPAAWTLNSIVCGVTSANGGSQTVTLPGVSIKLEEGENVTCTFANSQDQGSIELKKSWVGTAGQTTLNIGTSAAGSQVASQLTGAAGAAPLTTSAKNVNTGTYYVSETGGLTNYTSSLACTDNGQAVTPGVNNSVSVAKGHTVICTFTNTRNTGTLRVLKNVDLNGDSDYTDANETGNTTWKWQANGGSDHNTGDSAITVDTGNYALTETSQTNFHFVNLSCTNGTLNSNTVTVAKDANVVCTFTNARDTGTIELKKVWSGTGGQTTLNIGTTAGASDVDTQLTGAAGATPLTTGSNTVPTGTYYVSETGGLTDYSSVLACTDNGQSVTPGENNSLSVTTGHTIICTFTNTRNTGTLQVLKNVDLNGDGDYTDAGETGATDWKWQANGGSDHNTGDSAITVNTGDYSLTETNKTNFHFVSLLCTGGTLNGNTVTVTSGANVVCTFTNARDTGSVKVNKLLDNNGDGTFELINPNIFTWKLDGGADNQMGGTVNNVPTGSHNVTENSVNNYHYVGWYVGPTNSTQFSCSNIQTLNTTPLPASVTVVTGQTAEITICNQRDTGTIELKKVWSGTGGQTTLNIGTTAGASDVDTQLTGAAGATPLTTGSNTVPTGTYYVSETGGLTDYSSVLACTDNGQSVTPGENNSLSVTTGHTIICTFTNTRNQGTIIVKKVMVGGTSTFSFTGTPNGSISVNDGTIQTTVDTGSYSSVEAAKSGWDLTSVVCDDNNSTGDKDTRTATFNVEKGETVTCTFTNTKQPRLTVSKIVINHGQNKTAADFAPYKVDNTNVTLDTPTIFSIGSHTVSEATDAAFTQTFSGDCDANGNVSLAAGDDKTCTITNEEKPAKLIVNKVVVNDNGGKKVISDFPLFVDNTSVISGETNIFDSGSYVVSETNQTGYSGSISGDCDGDGNVTLVPGQTKTCTITNDDQPGGLIVHKITNPADDETVFSVTLSPEPTNGNATKDLSTTKNASYQQLNAGTYSVTEKEISGWDQTPNADENLNDCTDVVVTNGETTHCYITNTKRGNVIVTKYNDVNGNGQLDEEDSTLPGWTINLTDQESKETGQDGKTTFNNLLPGNFTLSEDLKPGWEQTAITCNQEAQPNENGSLELSLNAGQTVECNILNHNLIPVLTIAKSNNAIGDKAPGDVVTYQITLNVDKNGGPSKNTTVTDLLPEGFKYNSGSWHATLNGSDFPVSEPTYASPGVWTLGDLNPGDTVVMTYTATINGSQQTGTYYDNAWGEGHSANNDVVLALALPEGYVDTNFVGTQVSIVNGSKPGVDYKATQQVLGAEILPATGENTLWVIMATLLSVLGFGSLIAGFKLKKKYE